MGAFKKLLMSNGRIKCKCGSVIKCSSIKKHEHSNKHYKYLDSLEVEYNPTFYLVEAKECCHCQEIFYTSTDTPFCKGCCEILNKD